MRKRDSLRIYLEKENNLNFHGEGEKILVLKVLL